MKTLITKLGTTLLLVLFAIYSNAAIIYVDADASGADDGTTWSDAYVDLQDAIASSITGDEIWVAGGIYKPTSTTSQSSVFSIKGGVSMYGGFEGGETSKIHRNWNLNETILSGQIGNQSIDSDNSNAVVTFSNQTGDIVFDGFIVEDANSSSTYNFNFQSSDNVLVANCIFRDNIQTGTYQIYFNDVDAVFENCLFHDNEAPNLVSAFVSSTAAFYNCTFASNDVTRVFTGNTSGIVSLYNCISWGNGFSAAPLSIDFAYDCIMQDGTSGIAVFSNILNINPLFTNTSLDNYKLLASSPARDIGDNVNAGGIFDLEKKVRISSGDVDAGCYEYSNPDIIYVDINASGTDNGSSWTNAYNDLQDGIAAADIGDQIWVANGTYTPTSTTNREIRFYIPDGVSLYGGFAGGETNLNDRNWNTNVTILSGDIGTSSITDNTKRLLVFNSLDYPVVLDGFKVEDSYSESGTGNTIYFQSVAEAKILNCDFRNNAQTANAFTYFNSVNCTFENCLFRDNETSSYFFWVVVGADVCINNCTFSQNDAGLYLFYSNGAGNLNLMNSISHGNTQGLANSGIDNASNCVVETGTTGMTTFSNIISDDPQFINPAGNNFYLEFTSPAINHGVNTGISTYDLGHQTRIKGGIVDAGCYEKQINDIVYVDLNASGNDDGTSWTDAYESLSNALNEMGSGFDYWVAGGTYKANTTNVNIAINLPDDVNLIGGFDGTENNIGQRNLSTTPTILSGDIGTLGVNSDNTVSIFVIDNATAGILIDGFTFEDTYRSTSDFSDDRGAIRANHSSLEILNCIFRDNTAYAECGVNLDNTDLFMENCLFYDNTASAGALVSCTSGASDMEIVNTTFSNNTIGGSNNIIGALTGSSLALYNSIIWENGIVDLVSATSSSTADNCILNTGTEDLDSFSNIRTEDPLFVDAANDNYQITASSNAYDSGNAAYSSQSKDLNGDDRIIDTAIDRGCYESSVCEQPNDLCANAIELVVDATATFGSNRCATDTAGEESACFVNDGHSVWYTFEAPSTGSVEVISTWVSKFTSIFNIRHVVFEGTCGSLTQIACDNENSGGNGETTPLAGLIPGETYYIRFDGFNTQEGRFTIRVESTPVPPVPGVTYVDEDATGANDGSSWENAYDNLGDAFSNDANGDIIWVAEGTYKPNGSPWSVNVNVDIFGGFNGTETALDQRDIQNNETILSGEIGDQSDITDNLSRILFFSANGGSILDGFILEDSYFDPSESYTLNAAAVANVSTSFNNCIFRDNINNAFSCIVVIGNSGSPNINNYIENCLFYENSSAAGVILATGTQNFHITNSTITDNIATNSIPFMINAGSDGFVRNCIFWDNSGDLAYDVNVEAINCITEAPNPYSSTTEIAVHVDPLFTNPAADDYTLQSSSPAIGYGSNFYVSQLLDLAGNTRIQQTTVDAGPYESTYSTTYGCINPIACNYNAGAQTDDGSCILPDGCTNSVACNYDSNASCDDGTCILPDGCTDNMATNYNSTALCDDGSCIYGPVITYVDMDATGNNDGTSWTNAYTTVDAAIANSIDGEIIWVAEGVYYPVGTTSMQISAQMDLLGGFDGTETTEGDRDWESNPTIISGDLGTLGVQTDNSATLIEMYAANAAGSVIDGFIFEDTYQDVSNGYNLNAAVKLGVSGTILNCVFRDGITPFNSSVLFEGTFGTDLTNEQYRIENCLFYDNTVGWNVLRAYYNLEAQIVNCTFTDNVASDGSMNLIVGTSGTGFVNVGNSIMYGNTGYDGVSNITEMNHCIDEEAGSGASSTLSVVSFDPLFTNPGANNYTLTSSSPAIGYGLNGYSFTSVDLGLNMRIQQSTIDVGAYESPYNTIYGCIDPTACNYNSSAITDDGSCTFAPCGTCSGDANGDGVVDILDLVAVSSNFGCASGCTIGDANFDGVVDILDLIAVSSNFGLICP